ncbi:MAG: hypothetical protein CVT67_11435 [Actinobacteria bacterium HGW-Actinobacteria-7]|nr:MAG: hypothetical protein CVT67_11435 [Actinobacteria bacterium HGW-Actinobacteria-7]
MSREYPTRQAVVVIHGIGEQRPMQTLRGFVNAIVTATNKYGQKYWNKPDRMSESFELRRLTAPGDKKNWPTTDYFEYYWAFNMRDTKYRHVLNWLLRLLLTKPSNIPSRIRAVWWGSWTLVALAVVAAFEGWIAPPGEATQTGWLVSAVSLIGAGVLNTVFLGFIGDAARYLSPHPDNIAQRQAIRSDGIRLVRHLHESGKYGRVIVVGHSLGSVIAYDILRFVWDEYRDTSPTASSVDRDACIARMKALIKEGPGEDAHAFAERYQSLQKQLWREERLRGSGWLVTDLVTCGSPLAHASILLATSPDDLAERQRERELPTCPPRSQRAEDSFTYPCRISDECGHPAGTAPILHTSAPFACVRWTNLYFASDFIGGLLKGADKRHWNCRYLTGFTPLSHNMYWQPAKARRFWSSTPPKTWNAIRRLRGAMSANDMKLVQFPSIPAEEIGADD